MGQTIKAYQIIAISVPTNLYSVFSNKYKLLQIIWFLKEGIRKRGVFLKCSKCFGISGSVFPIWEGADETMDGTREGVDKSSGREGLHP